MTKKLIAIAVGPVQEFIKAARKTRDLWFGSQLLSDISSHVAVAVGEACGGPESLVFPAPLPDPDWKAKLLEKDFNVANVILAVVPENVAIDIRTKVVAHAREAAKQYWHQQADKAKKELQKSSHDKGLRESAWNAQVDDVIEFYAAWTKLDVGESNYRAARERVMRLLAGRKQVRDFTQCNTTGLDGVPKSSLDGARESVVMPLSDDVKRRLRLRRGEQLDCVGLTKRLATRRDKKTVKGEAFFPSVSRIAAQSWLEGCSHAAAVSNEIADECVDLQRYASELVDAKILHPVAENDVESFPFEGTIVFRNRYREFIAELGDDKKSVLEKMQSAATAVRRLEEVVGEPDPYVAVLLADGDRVGKTLSNTIEDSIGHREFSRKLAQFALDAKSIVEAHRGMLIYSGGDDVLAMVPVHRALDCSRELHRAFGAIMQAALPNEVAGNRPTLSVGVAIGHFMESLEFLLDFARDAEKHAKIGDRGESDERNGLAIHVHSRGSEPIKCRARWDELFGKTNDSPGQPLDERLALWVKLLLQGGLPHRAAYQLRELSDSFSNWPTGPALANALQKESVRVLNRKRTADGTQTAKEQIARLLQAVETSDDLHRVANELLIARRIYLATKPAQPKLANNQQGPEAEVTP